MIIGLLEIEVKEGSTDTAVVSVPFLYSDP
jgi:hypothetical protein